MGGRRELRGRGRHGDCPALEFPRGRARSPQASLRRPPSRSFNGDKLHQELIGRVNCDLAPHQILTAFPDAYNSFVGDHVRAPSDPPPTERPVAGLLLGKNPFALVATYGNNTGGFESLYDCAYNGDGCAQNSHKFGAANPFSPTVAAQLAAVAPTLRALLDAGVTLYSTFAVEDFEALQTVYGVLPPGIINVGHVSGAKYVPCATVTSPCRHYSGSRLRRQVRRAPSHPRVMVLYRRCNGAITTL